MRVSSALDTDINVYRKPIRYVNVYIDIYFGSVHRNDLYMVLGTGTWKNKMRVSDDGASERKTKYIAISVLIFDGHFIIYLPVVTRATNDLSVWLFPPCRITNTHRIAEKADYNMYIITYFKSLCKSQSFGMTCSGSKLRIAYIYNNTM